MKNNTNNLYVKNFDASWDEKKLREIFSPYGVVGTIFIKEDSSVAGRKFAFVCYLDPNNKEAGFISAERAV